MGSGFLIMLREGLEAALIVAIVLAYLRTLGRTDAFARVWLGTAAAVAVSLVAGGVVFVAVGELEGRPEEITEGIVALAAAGVLTWMIFWMARQARFIKGELHAKVDAAMASGSTLALSSIAFVAVLREGLESALFLLGTSVGDESNAARLGGGLLGVAAAAAIGYLVYRGSRRVNLRVFFRVTGILIILFAAGLVAKGVHEFQEAGLLGSVSEHVWDVSDIAWLDPESTQSGEFLGGLFGWSPDPSFEMLLVYFAYLIPIGGAFLAQTRRLPAAAPARVKAAAAAQATNS